MQSIAKQVGPASNKYIHHSLLPFDHLPQRGLFLINGGLAQIQFLPVLILLDEQYEMGSLERREYFPDAIDHVFELNALLLNFVLYFL
mgnify:CR=1 FL=1